MKHVWYGVSLKVNATLVLSGFEQGMNTNTRRETPLPIYHRLLLGCFCCKSSGGYWDAMRSGDVARCCSIPLEECWQIYKLFLAQQRKVTRVFRTAWVTERVPCGRLEWHISVAPWHCTPKQHTCHLSCEKSSKTWEAVMEVLCWIFELLE